MITPQLIEYIKSQKTKGVDKITVKNLLSNNNWPIEDVENALNQIYQQDLSAINNNPADFAKVKRISFILLVFSIISIISVWRSMLVIYITNSAMSKAGGLPYQFLLYVPLFNLLPIISSISAITYMYLSFKIRQGDKKGYYLTLFLVIGLFIFGILLGLFVVNNLGRIQKL